MARTWLEQLVKEEMEQYLEEEKLRDAEVVVGTDCGGFTMTSGTRPVVTVTVPANLRPATQAIKRPYKLPKIGFATN